MRIFGGDRVKALMERMGMPDDEPIEHPMVSKSILDAQAKVEGRNFDIRKHLLDYDDVMSEQRKTVYTIRQQLLLGTYKPEVLDDEGKPTGKARKIEMLPRMVDELMPAIDAMFLSQQAAPEGDEKSATKPEKVKALRDIESLRNEIYQSFGYRFDTKEGEEKDPKALYERLKKELPQSLTEQRERLLDLVDGIVSAMVEECCPMNKAAPEDWDWKGMRSGFLEHFGVKPKDFDHLGDRADVAHTFYVQATELMDEREKEMGSELLLRVFRHFYLEEIDRQWVEHLTNMEHLRDGIGLRGYGQRDPKQEYKKEGYSIFVTMMATTSSNVATKLFKVRVQKETEIERLEREDMERHQRAQANLQLAHGGELYGPDDEPPPPPPRRAPQVTMPKREAPKIDKNDPCPCGSGDSFKKCHGAALEDDA